MHGKLPDGRKPAGRARPRLALSLRAKMLAIIAGGALFALVATLVLLFAVRQADRNLARAATAQRHLELLILLSGRVSDYGLAAMEAVQRSGVSTNRLDAGRARVASVFSALDTIVSEQVGFEDTDTARNAAATKSLMLARMKAQFEALQGRIAALNQAPSAGAEGIGGVRSAMDAFGVSFAPLLAQALENERADVERARADMTRLRERVTVFAILWIATATILSVLLYMGAGRSILSRIAETVRGATAISSGRLEERLAPSGRDELTLLMARFNRMAESLSRREQRLLTAQRDLKRTIAARTSDLRAANRRLAEIDTSRQRFFADISHELRTPLTVILGESEVSLRQTGSGTGGPVKRAMRTIHTRALTLRRRVDDLLRVARSESGQLDLDFARGDLNAIAAEALEDVRPFARRISVRIAFQPAARPMEISCDEEWLRQVVAGLLVNALKYSPEGATVDMAIKPRKDTAVLTIRDRGCGIAAEDLPHIFDRFYRGRNQPDRQARGYGVGLALVKWVIGEHDGEITVKSPADKARRASGLENPGTVVTVTLPLASTKGRQGRKA